MTLPRLILLHKQTTSSRLLFLCLQSGVLAFSPLPVHSVLRDEYYSPRIRIHPAAVVQEAEVRLGLPAGAIVPEPEFQAWADTPEGDIPVLLAVFASLDPPFAAAERCQARFIGITESRQLSEIERLLLRRAYEHALG